MKAESNARYLSIVYRGTTRIIPAIKRTAGTVKAFRLLGVPVRLHFTFILLVIFVVVSVLGSAQSSAELRAYSVGGYSRVCCFMNVGARSAGFPLRSSHYRDRDVPYRRIVRHELCAGAHCRDLCRSGRTVR